MSFRGLDADARAKYAEMKNKHAYRYIILKVDGGVVRVEKAAPPSETFPEFLNNLPLDCRWAVYDFDFTTKNGQKHSKLVFIIWSPDRAPSRSKMRYASWNNVINQQFETGGLPLVFQATDYDEITHEALLDKVTRRMV